MKQFGIYSFFLLGLFYFSEGKPCPEKTRPHKTRCDAYFKCQDLPSKTHVWIPATCEQGLIYERDLKLCVLPEDDWECILEDFASPAAKGKQATVSKTTAPTNNASVDSEIKVESLVEKQKSDSDSVKLVTDIGMSSDEDNDIEGGDYESSGNGEALMGPLRAETKTADENGNDADRKEPKESASGEGTPSRIDPVLTAHLQRLSQLVDGLKQTYQNHDKQQAEMRPDQLNAFLAHFNIKNTFNSLNPNREHESNEESDSTPASLASIPASTSEPQTASQNASIPQESAKSKMKPETKVMLANELPNGYNKASYSSSQVVLTRPDGSVVFNVPSYSNEQHFVEDPYIFDVHHSPKISQETLKTVLELSQQMIATQNVPKIIPNSAFYQQPSGLRPFYLSPNAFSGAEGSPFSSYYGSQNSNHHIGDYGDDDDVHRYSSAAIGQKHKPFGPNNGHKTHDQHQNNAFSKPSTTIIHNNVIPVHVSATNSGEREVFDSYGQSLGRYPPFNNVGSGSNAYDQHRPPSNDYDGDPFPPTTPANHYSDQYPAPYAVESGLTTMQPFQVTASTVAEYFTPSQHLDEHNVHYLYQPADRFPTVQYDNIPRPIDHVRPSQNQPQPVHQQVERPNQKPHFYGQQNRDSAFSSHASSNRVKPSYTQNLESMEEIASEEASSYDDQTLSNQQSYAYQNEPNQYLNSGPSKTHPHKHPYMPRPRPLPPSFSTSSNKLQPSTYSLASSHFTDGTQLVNVGGNFIRYDVFQNTILPLLGSSANDELSHVEVITCATGVRQPNATDCTRYYVCSKKDGKVLSYSCPPYTAFNQQTRICDAHTYAACSPSAVVSSYTVSGNKRLQLEALQALRETKRRQQDALKAQAQSIVHLAQQYDAQVNPPVSSESGSSQEKDLLNTYVQQAASMASSATSTPKPGKKRKYYCREGDKIADQTSIYSYFVCYKNAQGTMKGHKMTCSKGLLFCPKTTMCTLPSKC